MAIRDNLIYELKADAGQLVPKNSVGLLEELTGGTISLVDNGSGAYAWDFSGSNSAATLPSSFISCTTEGTGCTIAITFRRVAAPTVANQSMVRWTNDVGDGVMGLSRGNAIAPTDIRAQAYFAYQTSTVKTSVPDSDLKTYVLRLHTGSASLTDVASSWYQTVGRSGTAPDATGPFETLTSKSLTKLLVDTSNGGNYRIRDWLLWTRELTDAECAAVADDLRTATQAPPAQASGDSTGDSGTTGGSAAGGSASQASGNATGDTGSAGGSASSAAPSAGTVTSEPLYSNAGVLKANAALNFAAVYHPTTGALVVRKTGISTNASGIYTFSDAAVSTGIDYRHDWETADGTRCMPQKAAA